MSTLLRWFPALLLGVPVLLAWLTLAYVDLTPRVDQRFFFTPESPIYEEHQAIDRRFANQELLVVTAYADNIATATYRQRIQQLSEELNRLRAVSGVRSLVDGPEDLADARDSPLWRRLLLLDGIEASNLILLVADRDPRRLIDAVDGVLDRHRQPDFRLRLAGVPYVVDAIGRNLEHDFKVFSLAAVGVSALVILMLFRSVAILLGSLAACATAALVTLLIQDVLGGRIGLLTANIITIAFVLTLSHVVFLSNNWRRLAAGPAGEPRFAAGAVARLRRALVNTAPASAWCMVTALLGFTSLLLVEAQPLRELGFGGAVATLAALVCAYTIFPLFLLWARASATPQAAKRNGRWPGLPPRWAAAAMLLAALAAGLGALRLNSDPSLLAYFKHDSEVRRSLELIDSHGGSSPLSIAVRRKDGGRLDNNESYERMWALQRELQEDPAVGTVLSLPVLMAEANRSLLAKLLTWSWLLDILSKPEYSRAAEGFINTDRTEALFMLRMVEGGRSERRTEVIARLENVIARHDFVPALTGGIYALQGRLADLVVRSLYEGLAALMLACALIALVLTRSLTAGLALAGCTAAIPAVTLGLAGLLRVPLDIVVTPAVNVAVGVAVDSMIHFGAAWRRAGLRGLGAEAVRAAQREQAPGIVAFFVVVTAGFAIFTLSNFPPTQRFGLAVVAGTAVAAVMALWIFPGLLQKRRAGSGSAQTASRQMDDPPALRRGNALPDSPAGAHARQDLLAPESP